MYDVSFIVHLYFSLNQLTLQCLRNLNLTRPQGKEVHLYDPPNGHEAKCRKNDFFELCSILGWGPPSDIGEYLCQIAAVLLNMKELWPACECRLIALDYLCLFKIKNKNLLNSPTL